jgi:hypothetical protein
MMLLSGMTMGLTVRLCGAMGEMIIPLMSDVSSGPPTLSEYAVEPVGVEIINPSAQYELRKFVQPCLNGYHC